jgi:rod shape-determining protein MreC
LFLSSNDEPQVKKIKTFALGNFTVLNEAANHLTSILKKEPSKEELQKENARLMLELERLRKNRMENFILRDMLSMIDTSNYKLEPANVISKLVNKVQGNFIINKGSKFGISTGMPVIGTKGLIGIVKDVSEDFCVVHTLLNSSLSLAVTVQNINVDGILSWNGVDLIIKNIPTTYDVKVGERIVTSDFSTKFPPNIPVGFVSRKESIVLGLLHTLEITPIEDIRAIDNVFILKIIPSKQINNLELNLTK